MHPTVIRPIRAHDVDAVTLGVTHKKNKSRKKVSSEILKLKFLFVFYAFGKSSLSRKVRFENQI
jgi:hypothetical protein